MVFESSSQIMCGQILFGLQMSKLNYVVRETPYSAYITIRKKFIKPSDDKHEPLYVKNNVDVKVTNDEKEKLDLKEKNANLERTVALLTLDLEKAECEYELLDKKNIELENNIENMYKEEKKNEQ